MNRTNRETLLLSKQFDRATWKQHKSLLKRSLKVKKVSLCKKLEHKQQKEKESKSQRERNEILKNEHISITILKHHIISRYSTNQRGCRISKQQRLHCTSWSYNLGKIRLCSMASRHQSHWSQCHRQRWKYSSSFSRLFFVFLRIYK
jgi:hypothetical protein